MVWFGWHGDVHCGVTLCSTLIGAFWSACHCSLIDRILVLRDEPGDAAVFSCAVVFFWGQSVGHGPVFCSLSEHQQPTTNQPRTNHEPRRTKKNQEEPRRTKKTQTQTQTTKPQDQRPKQQKKTEKHKTQNTKTHNKKTTKQTEPTIQQPRQQPRQQPTATAATATSETPARPGGTPTSR